VGHSVEQPKGPVARQDRQRSQPVLASADLASSECPYRPFDIDPLGPRGVVSLI
jgi:hypothetical protein